jgi:hypothetical protein
LKQQTIQSLRASATSLNNEKDCDLVIILREPWKKRARQGALLLRKVLIVYGLMASENLAVSLNGLTLG